MSIKFTICGNQENQEGNPVPYVRSTRGALWRKDGKRYAEWKNYVVRNYLDYLHRHANRKANNIANMAILHHNKPIIIFNNQKSRMDIKIFWKNNAHGDGDNVWKGIADALFVSDKNIDGSFESGRALDGKGKVEVIISIK